MWKPKHSHFLQTSHVLENKPSLLIQDIGVGNSCMEIRLSKQTSYLSMEGSSRRRNWRSSPMTTTIHFWVPFPEISKQQNSFHLKRKKQNKTKTKRPKQTMFIANAKNLTHMPLTCFKKGDGFCEPISPLILCQIKQISVKSFYCLRADPVHSAGRQYYLFFIQKSRFSTYYTFPHSSRLYPLWINTLKSEKDIFSDLRKHLTRWCILHVCSTPTCSIFHLWCDVCQEAGAQGLGDSRSLMKDTHPHVHLTGRPTCSKAGAVVLLWAQTALPGRTGRLCQPKARSHLPHRALSLP